MISGDTHEKEMERYVQEQVALADKEQALKIGRPTARDLAKLRAMRVDELVQRFVSIATEMESASNDYAFAKLNRLYFKQSAIKAELKSRVGDQRSVLIPLFEHQNSQVRYRAAAAAWVMAPDAAMSVVATIASDRYHECSSDAASLLEAIAAGRYVPE